MRADSIASMVSRSSRMQLGAILWFSAFLGCAATRITVVRPLTAEKEAEINGIVDGRTANLTLEGEPAPFASKSIRFADNSVSFAKRDPAPPPATPAWEVRWLPESAP